MEITLANGIKISGNAINEAHLRAIFQVRLEGEGISNRQSLAILIDKDTQKQKVRRKTQEWVNRQIQGLELQRHFNV